MLESGFQVFSTMSCTNVAVFPCVQVCAIYNYNLLLSACKAAVLIAFTTFYLWEGLKLVSFIELLYSCLSDRCSKASNFSAWQHLRDKISNSTFTCDLPNDTIKVPHLLSIICNMTDLDYWNFFFFIEEPSSPPPGLPRA